MKKFFVVLMSLLLVFTMIPATAFGEVGEEEIYDMADTKVGDLILPLYSNYICKIYSNSDKEINIKVEITLAIDHPEWDMNAGDVYQINETFSNGRKDIMTPVGAVVDEIIIDKEAGSFKYVLHEVPGISGTYRKSGVILQNTYMIQMTCDSTRPLNIKAKFFEDSTLSKSFLNGTYDFEKTVQISETFFMSAPIGLKVVSAEYDEESNTMSFVYRKYTWNEDDFPYKTGDIIAKGTELGGIKSNQDNASTTFKFIIYEDETCQKAIDKNGYSYSVTPLIYGSMGNSGFVLPVNVMFAGIEDNSLVEGNQIVTFKMYEIGPILSEDEKESIEGLENTVNSEFEKINSSNAHLEIADPSKMGIEGYTRNSATMYVGNGNWTSHQWGLTQRMSAKELGFDSDGGAVIQTQLYKDKAFTQPISNEFDANWDSYYPIQQNVTYYADVYYLVYVGEATKEIHFSKPVEVSFEYVSVSATSNEVKQIKANSDSKIIFELTDLARINSVVVGGLDSFIPPLKNPDAFLKKQNENVYKKLVGNTKLDISIVYGGGGDAFEVVGDASCGISYYVDDVYYGDGGYKDFQPIIYINQILYVPEGTTDRAAFAENRIKDYLGEGSFEAEFTKVTDKTFVELCCSTLNLDEERLKNILEIDSLNEIKAMYFTEHGIAFYSHESKTDESSYLGAYMTCLPGDYTHDLFTNSKLEEVGILEYMVDPDGKPVTNTKAYAPYKLVLTDINKGVSHDYLYMVGIGTEEQLKEPFADWKDEETGIVTKGENGYIPFDAYTKIRVIKGGEEIKFIKNKVGDDKAVNCFDINAYTNFKGGKLEDLGDGLMKVMIPIGKIKEEGVKAHYVDDEGNVQDLEFTVEEVEGQKYVCFIVKHFSVYAISGESTAPQVENPFKDVKEADYFYDPVCWALENAITDGMTPTQFAPNSPCTRGQVVTFLWRAAGSPKVGVGNTFKDVKKTEYYAEAVNWAVQNGITDGTSPTTFSPNAPCTRAQVVTFLWRVAGEPKAGTDNAFKDVKKNEYYSEPVTWAVREAITDGMSPTQFAPNATCTRGQIVTFLYRYYNA